MFSFFSRASAPAVTLPTNPYQWDLDILAEFLRSLNPKKEADREEARRRMESLESAMLADCRGPFTSVQMVLQSDVKKLPIQLYVYRELHEYLQIWLWK